MVLITIKKPYSFDHNEDESTPYAHVNVAFIDNLTQIVSPFQR